MRTAAWARAVLRRLFNMVFALGYLAYVHTPLGLMIHTRSLRRRRQNNVSKHSEQTGKYALSTCDVWPIAMLSDNYAYLLVDRSSKQAAFVDPCDATEALAAAASVGVRPCELTAAFITHHHVDHSGGNYDLRKALPHCRIVGGRGENVPAATQQVEDGDIVTVGATRLRVHSTPFHTLHHVAFVVLKGEDDSGGLNEQPTQKQLQGEQEAVFSGDVLLPGGCGRLFRGTAATACALLNDGLFATLPDAALLFPGHEYTVPNLRFACWLLPAEEAYAQRLAAAETMRHQRRPTVPLEMRVERAANPFMAVRTAAVRAAVLALSAVDEALPTLASDASDVEVFAVLRMAKDGF